MVALGGSGVSWVDAADVSVARGWCMRLRLVGVGEGGLRMAYARTGPLSTRVSPPPHAPRSAEKREPPKAMLEYSLMMFSRCNCKLGVAVCLCWHRIYRATGWAQHRGDLPGGIA